MLIQESPHFEEFQLISETMNRKHVARFASIDNRSQTVLTKAENTERNSPTQEFAHFEEL
jgi:hypothetical protein